MTGLGMLEKCEVTPGNFLIGVTFTLPPEADPITNGSLNTKWSMVQGLLHSFWKRWTIEYLPQLQIRGKWKGSIKPINIGDLALLEEKNVSPIKWKLVRIVQLHPGTDGIIRVVTIKNSPGRTFRRSVVN